MNIWDEESLNSKKAQKMLQASYDCDITEVFGKI